MPGLRKKRREARRMARAEFQKALAANGGDVDAAIETATDAVQEKFGKDGDWMSIIATLLQFFELIRSLFDKDD